MSNLKTSLVLLAVVASVVSQNLIAPRLIDGVPIDTLKRFAHHVTIVPIREYGVNTICGGSILNEQWILTSAVCVDQSVRLQLHFEKLYNNTVGSYSAVVNNDAIHIYPTYFDDIALVKIPFRLIFSDTIKPVSLSSAPLTQVQGKLAVLPGFDTKEINDSTSSQSPQLTYAMFNIISNDQCKKSVEGFDEYLQLCTVGWGNNPNTPCVTDSGSGLLTGWPAKSQLVGIYSFNWSDCDSSTPAVYTNVAKYISWINSIINS